MTDAYREEDGRKPNRITRVLALISLICGFLVILLPPWGILPTLFMCIILLGDYRILRGKAFPNFWAFWVCAAIAFFLCSGVTLPISHWEMPAAFLPACSYYLSCFGAIATMTVGVAEFVATVYRDLRTGNFRFDND